MSLNAGALRIADAMACDAAALGVSVGSVAGARIIDCGVNERGGLRAGLGLARVCLAGLAEVSIVPGDESSLALPRIQVVTDQPVRACMASQYAGWQINVGNYFAMGSGPMRAIYGKEKLFDDIGCREAGPVAVGILEGKLPSTEVITYIAEKLQRQPTKLTLLVARTKSMAGNVQVVARSLEMALHKLHELNFDLAQVVSGMGAAPLPPPASDDLASIGRTNDSILYAGRVVVWVNADDAHIAEIGPKVPASASSEFGALFAELFAKYKDFYKIDPLLFSPAEITFCNVRSGRSHRFGRTEPELLRKSFGV